MKSREEALEKVKKLLRMATDGRGNEHEAEAAARQARAVMLKWQIDEAEALATEIEKDEAFGSGFGSANPDSRGGHKFTTAPNWVGMLSIGVSRAFDCVVDYVRTPEGVKVRYRGLDSDVAVAVWMHEFLCRETWRLSKEFGGGRSVQFAFRQGCATRLQQRLVEMADEDVPELGVTTGTALVVIRKRERVEEMFGEQKEKKVNLAKREPDALMGLVAGKVAGDKVALRKVLEGNSGKKQVEFEDAPAGKRGDPRRRNAIAGA